MSKASTTSTINQARFRVSRAEAAWTELAELLRGPAAALGYRGPALAEVEKIAGEIAEVRQAIRNWVFVEALRRRPRSALRRTAVRAVLEAIGGSAP